MYIKRHLEEIIEKISKMFPALIVTGARQVGKTTLLKHFGEDIGYITLDDPINLVSANTDSGNFFKTNPPPIIIDEVQYATNLFIYIKMIVDNTNKKGLFYLTGSQQFRMMKNLSESLAGRIGIINLLGLSLREIRKESFNKPFLPTEDYINERRKNAKSIEYKELWKTIHKGFMPALYIDDIDCNIYYASYTKTYIERDVRESINIGNELKFIKFMTVLAARTSQVLNKNTIANEVGISNHTVEQWLSVLVSSNIVYLLEPYYNNVSKRALKTQKIYFLDTGLAAYLTKWKSPEVLENGAMAGAFFETYVISEILKSYYNAGIIEPSIYYYRDRDGKEIDIIIEENGAFYPIEIKKTSNPEKKHFKSFKVIDEKLGLKKGEGAIICMYENYIKLDVTNSSIPVWYI